MDTEAVVHLVDELEDDLDDLEDNLASILNGSLAVTSRKLPLLDRAKLNVLLVYSIESLLFSYLKIHGVQVREHSIFKELARVKQYFEKIKAAEQPADTAEPTATLNKAAAARVIMHGLSGNEKYDLDRAEREAREKFLANRRLRNLESQMKQKALEEHHKDEDTSMADALVQAAQFAAVPKVESTDNIPAEGSESDGDSDEDGEVREEQTEPNSAIPAQQPNKSKKRKLSNKSRRAKRKRETGFQNVKTPEQTKLALERQAARKAKNGEAKKARKSQAAPSTAG